MRSSSRRGRRGSWRAAMLVAVLGAVARLGSGVAAWADEGVDAVNDPVASLRRSDHPLGNGLALDPSALRVSLEAFVDAEFALERPLAPEAFATGFVDALVAGGLSTEEAVRTAAAFAAHGHDLSFADRRRMTATLSATYPEWPVPDSLTERRDHPGAALPPGGVWVECVDGLDGWALFWERKARGDPSWLPRDAFDAPIEGVVSACSFSIDAPGVTGEDDTLRVGGRFELFIEQPGKERESLTRTSIAVAEPVGPRGQLVFVPSVLIPSSRIHVPRSAFPLPDDARLVLEVHYDVVHHAPGVAADTRAAVAGRALYRIMPRMKADSDASDPSARVERLEVVPLGTDGNDLARPEVLSTSAIDTICRFVLRKPQSREELERQAVAARKQAALLGREITAVPLLRAADGTSGELTLPADRTHILVVGATWCGPCHDLAPAVEAFVGVVAGRDEAPRIHRLSIDDDAEAFGAALAAYPSGICTDAFEEDFAVDAVPTYFLIRDGKVAEHGILDKDRIAAWRQAYAASLDERAKPGDSAPAP